MYYVLISPTQLFIVTILYFTVNDTHELSKSPFTRQKACNFLREKIFNHITFFTSVPHSQFNGLKTEGEINFIFSPFLGKKLYPVTEYSYMTGKGFSYFTGNIFTPEKKVTLKALCTTDISHILFYT